VRGHQLLRTFHRWLGAALCLLFLSWFVSGIVMTFAGFPRVGERDKLAHAAALREESIRLQPPALAGVTNDAESIELRALGARALYTVRSAGRKSSIFADTGERPTELEEDELRAIASSWFHGASAHSARLTEVDQWTPQADRRGQLPCLRFRASDQQASELYLSLVDGEVMQLTTARTRFLAWIGAIPHWLYPIMLRRHAQAWQTLVIALSALGAVASATGLAHGLAVARFARRSARGTRLALSPFQDRWLAWHHRLGLFFGLLSFTWVLSGMLSFYPFASSATSNPTARDVSAFRGAPLAPQNFTRNLVDVLAQCRTSLGGAVNRIELLVAGRAPYYRCSDGRGASRSLSADTDTAASEALATATLSHFTKPLGNGATVESETMLATADAYYYPTHLDPELEFPVLRTRFSGGFVTYVSPRSLRVVRRYSSAGAAYRWLYHGLHSLDFPALYRRPWLWHPLIVCALSGASLLAASGVWLSLRGATGLSARRWRARGLARSEPNRPEVDAS
jgi:hypothetical protein